MSRHIFNPFAKEPETKTPFKAEALSIDDENICPKCKNKTINALIGGQAGVNTANVTYCKQCRVALPMRDG